MKRTGLTSTPHRGLQTVRDLNLYILDSAANPVPIAPKNTLPCGLQSASFFYLLAGSWKGRGERVGARGRMGDRG